jgi:hypothetical protein
MTETGSGSDEGIARQRLRLASLESCEDRMRALREQECDLEVEHIAAQAALHSVASRLRPELDPLLASRLGRSLEHRRELEGKRRDAGTNHGAARAGSTREVDALRAGHAALAAWLDASRPRESGGVARAAKVALLIATIATVWAAFAIHLAFLLLLAVVVGPVSFAMGRSHDAEWRRVGARRRFDTSGLAALASWDEETVRARMAELEALLENADRDRPSADAGASLEDHGEAQALAAQIADADARIASDLAAAGLSTEDTRGEVGDWMRLLARADRSRDSLERVKSERKRLRAEATELRNQLVHYLRSQGVKPTEHQDTAAAIGERLDRLSGSNRATE